MAGWDDIDSEKACRDYQRTLEDAIDDARAQYPECQIDLSISGGRKSMTAMTIFAAQKQKIKFVYHTLITDGKLEERMVKETEIMVLRELGQEERNNRLFLPVIAQ